MIRYFLKSLDRYYNTGTYLGLKGVNLVESRETQVRPVFDSRCQRKIIATCQWNSTWILATFKTKNFKLCSKPLFSLFCSTTKPFTVNRKTLKFQRVQSFGINIQVFQFKHGFLREVFIWKAIDLWILCSLKKEIKLTAQAQVVRPCAIA